MGAYGPDADPSLGADTQRAAALLFELAGELRRAPLASSLRLHVRALQMKREVAAWDAEMPSESERRAVLDEILALQRAAERLRRYADWTSRLAV